jgi:thymidine kinase
MAQATYGEQLVNSLLKSLTRKRKDYFYVQEPALNTRHGHAHPDFVIVSAKQGVIVLEVKDYVKIIKADQKNIVIERRDRRRVEEPNPIQIAREYALNLADAFMNVSELVKKRPGQHGKRELKFPWMYAVAFPNIDNQILKHLTDTNIWGQGYVFGKTDLTETRFETCLDAIPPFFRLEYPLNNEIREKIRAVLDPTIILEEAKGIETLRQTTIIREPLKTQTPVDVPKQKVLLDDTFLTTEARELSENAMVRLVRGVAGSGKSLVLARRAKFLAEQYPHLRILVMAFNKDLTADLQRRIPSMPNIEINNFHSICRSIVKHRLPYNTDIIRIDDWLEDHMSHFLQASSFSAEFVAQEIEWRKELELFDSDQYLTYPREGRGKALNKDRRKLINQFFDQYTTAHHSQQLVDWSDLPRLALAELQQGHPMRASYDVILIDEAQDFAPSWIAVVKKLLKPDGALFMCDDPTQSLFRSFSWRQKGIEVVGRTRILQVPFRCTKEITLAAHSLINGDSNLNQSEEVTQPDLSSYELASGDVPKLVGYRSLEQEIRGIEQTTLTLTNAQIEPGQIAVLCHSKRIIRHWAHLKNRGFYVATFNQMKGLEFRTVIVPHLNTAFDQHDTPKDETFVSEMRRRIFTAMTRARENLILSYHGALPSELKLLEPHVQHENQADYGRSR